MHLKAHQLPEFFYLAAADRDFKVQITEPQNIGIVKPRLDLADLVQVDAE